MNGRNVVSTRSDGIGAWFVRWSVNAFFAIAIFFLIFQAQAVFIKVGPFSLSVYGLVLASVLLGLAVALSYALNLFGSPRAATRYDFKLAIALAPLIVLWIYGLIRLLLEWRIEGAQNFLALTVLSFGPLVFGGIQQHIRGDTALRIISAVSAGMSLIYLVFKTTGLEGFADRQFAMIALVGLAAAVGMAGQSRIDLAVPWLLFVAIVASGSRTASVLALVMLLLLPSRQGESLISLIIKRSGIFIAGAAVGVLIYVTLPLIEQRESDRGVDGTVTEILTNTNGRVGAWFEFLALLRSPSDWLVGRGTGAAMEFGTANLPSFPHPHNEYLRYLVDYGILGLTLLAIGTLIVLILLMRNKGFLDPARRAGVLVLMGMAGMSVTDGPLYSSFVIVPAVILVGLGLKNAQSESTEKVLNSKSEEL